MFVPTLGSPFHGGKLISFSEHDTNLFYMMGHDSLLFPNNISKTDFHISSLINIPTISELFFCNKAISESKY